MNKFSSGLIVLLAALLLLMGLGNSSQVRATSGDDDPGNRLANLENRLSALETENAALKDRITALENPETIRAKSIILEGATGRVYISADDAHGPQIEISAAGIEGNGGGVQLGVFDLDLSRDDSTPSPNLIMNIKDGNQSYLIHLLATKDGPSLQYWGSRPSEEGSMRSLARFCPENLVLMDSWLSADELAALTATASATSESN
jgi:hypothetical protein